MSPSSRTSRCRHQSETTLTELYFQVYEQMASLHTKSCAMHDKYCKLLPFSITVSNVLQFAEDCFFFVLTRFYLIVGNATISIRMCLALFYVFMQEYNVGIWPTILTAGNYMSNILGIPQEVHFNTLLTP